jgi:hypothetical protein
MLRQRLNVTKLSDSMRSCFTLCASRISKEGTHPQMEGQEAASADHVALWFRTQFNFSRFIFHFGLAEFGCD